MMGVGDLDETVNALAGSTFDKKELIRNCFWRIKFQVCMIVSGVLNFKFAYWRTWA